MPVSPEQNYKRKRSSGVSFRQKKKKLYLKVRGEEEVGRFVLLDTGSDFSFLTGNFQEEAKEVAEKLSSIPAREKEKQVLEEKTNMADKKATAQQTPGQKDAQRDVEDSAALLKELKKFVGIMFKSDIDDLQERVAVLEKQKAELETQISNMGKTIDTKAETINTELDNKIKNTNAQLDSKVEAAQQVTVEVTNNFTTVKQTVTEEVQTIRQEFGGDLSNVEDNLAELMGQVMALNETVGGIKLTRPVVDLAKKKQEAFEKIQEKKKKTEPQQGKKAEAKTDNKKK